MPRKAYSRRYITFCELFNAEKQQQIFGIRQHCRLHERWVASGRTWPRQKKLSWFHPTTSRKNCRDQRMCFKLTSLKERSEQQKHKILWCALRPNNCLQDRIPAARDTCVINRLRQTNSYRSTDLHEIRQESVHDFGCIFKNFEKVYKNRSWGAKISKIRWNCRPGRLIFCKFQNGGRRPSWIMNFEILGP